MSTPSTPASRCPLCGKPAQQMDGPNLSLQVKCARCGRFVLESDGLAGINPLRMYLISAAIRNSTGAEAVTISQARRAGSTAQHKTFPMATDMQVYFCDPQSPWQHGSNENTNGLLRQYLPKNADLSRFSQSELDEIALRLNTRPRQTLGFRTPADKLQASVASTP